MIKGLKDCHDCEKYYKKVDYIVVEVLPISQTLIKQSFNQENQGTEYQENQGSDKSKSRFRQKKFIPMQNEDLTRKIIGCAMEVHKRLGNGFQEVIYQRALEVEMRLSDLEFVRELEMSIFYREEEIGTRRVDFFVEGKIMVELKAIIKLDDVHLAQALNYLEAYKMEIGLLINFGSKSLEFKRVHNQKIKPIQ
jgi:GxxExxY protein